MRHVVLACFYGVASLGLHTLDSSWSAADEEIKVIRSRFYIATPDGENAKVYLVPKDYHQVGSPAFSADGKKLAFDGWKSQHGESFSSSHILVANADGTDMKDIGPGAMPSWSPSGDRIVFSQPSPYGVAIMNADGSNRHMIQDNAWGAQWSPDGKKIAYTVSKSGNENIQIYHIVESRTSTVFPDGESPYSRIFWNMAWSPDSQRVCFKGRKSADSSYEIVTVNIASMKEGLNVHYKSKLAPYAGFAWHPMDDMIIFSPESIPGTLFKFNCHANDMSLEPLKISVPGQIEGDVCFTPDGQHLLFSVRGEE